MVSGAKRKVAWRIFDAQHFGVPQRRKRVFVIASSREGFDPSKVLFEFPSLRGDTCQSFEERKGAPGFAEGSFGAFKQTNVAATTKASGGCLGGGSETLLIDISHLSDGARLYKNKAPTLAARMGTGGNSVPCCLMDQGGSVMEVQRNKTGTLRAQSHGNNPIVFPEEGSVVRRLTPVECERLQGFPDNWTKISYRGKSPDNCPDTPRYKAIGNSWAVPVVRWLGRRIEAELLNF